MHPAVFKKLRLSCKHSRSSGSANSPQVQQYFNRLITPPTGPMEDAYREIIDGLVLDGIFDRLDMFYILPGEISSAAFVNVIKDRLPVDPHIGAGSLGFVPVNFVTPTATAGWTSTSTVAVHMLSDERLTSAAGLTMTPSDFCFFCYNSINIELSLRDIWAQEGDFEWANPDTVAMYTRWGGNWLGAQVNTAGTEVAEAGITSSAGLSLGNRTGPNLQALWKNTVGSPMVKVDENTSANYATLPSKQVFYNPWRRGRVWGMGKSLSDSQIDSLRSRIETFSAAVTGGTP